MLNRNQDKKEKTMQKTYKLAKESEFGVHPFGPLMTLPKAEIYQREMETGGFPVLIVNTQEEDSGPVYGQGSNPSYWERLRKANARKGLRYVPLNI